MFIRTKSTTLLQIFNKVTLNFGIIFKNVEIPDNLFFKGTLSMDGFKVCGEGRGLCILRYG